jgi:hypothetical protein
MPNSMSSVSREIPTLRRSLRAMDRSLRRLGPKLKAMGNGRGNGKADRPTRKLKLSSKRRAQLKLQGQYMGYLRGLRPTQKTEVKGLREKKGMRAAVARAKRMMLKGGTLR